MLPVVLAEAFRPIESDGRHHTAERLVKAPCHVRYGFQLGRRAPGDVCMAVGAIDEIADGQHFSRVVADTRPAQRGDRGEVDACRCGAVATHHFLPRHEHIRDGARERRPLLGRRWRDGRHELRLLHRRPELRSFHRAVECVESIEPVQQGWHEHEPGERCVAQQVHHGAHVGWHRRDTR